MGIYLLSLSHKVTPLEIRSQFAYTQQQQEAVLEQLTATEMIDEAVLLSTCNRMEIYCHGTDQEGGIRVLEEMERIAVRIAGADADLDMKRYMRRYYDQKAIHHLFEVAAGLDSMLIGEDQILGQVKLAYDYAKERGYCKTYLNTLFRDAITGAKRVKTDTSLSRTPVSTAGLALKAAQAVLGSLENKKLLIIGATGNIGGIVLKNAQAIKGLDIYVTIREHTALARLGHDLHYTPVMYEERFAVLDDMDIILSATASPHYTVTKKQVEQSIKTEKKRVFLDLAVPLDLEASIRSYPDTWYYNLEDMASLARQNNEKKQAEAEAAEMILEEYEEQYLKWLLFQTHRDTMEELKELMVQDACEKGVETAVNRLFYRIREAGSVGELEAFFSAAAKVNQEEKAAAMKEPQRRQRRKKAEQPAYFPLFFNLAGQDVLVVGAGKIASRRAEVLTEFGSRVTVVAPEGAELMGRLSREGALTWKQREFEEQDLEGRNIVITATGDSELNRNIADRCREKHILVNHAGDKSQCDFYFPGVAREGGIVAGVTTSGKDHGLAREITGQLQLWLKKFSGR